MSVFRTSTSGGDSMTRTRFTLGQEARKELRLLNERHTILPLEPCGGAPVSADITLCAIQRLGILSAALAGVRHGTPGRSAHDDDLYLGITISGRSVARQGRTDVVLTSGDSVLLSAREGFTMTHVEPVQFLGLRLSRARLADHVHSIDASVMQPIRRQPALAWLTRFVDSQLMTPSLEDPIPMTGEVLPLTVEYVYDIVGAALTSARESALTLEGAGVRVARLHAMKSHILANLGSPYLSVSAVAAHHGITPRYLHKLFESEGATYSAFVLGRRLARVHRMLTDFRFAQQPISAIAFDVGFGDLSYFNREFKRRYNAKPSEVRRQATEARRRLDASTIGTGAQE